MTELDLLLDLGLPGLVFLGLCLWLIRKAAKAARTEGDLEGERLQGSLADELSAGRARAAASQQPNLSAVPDTVSEITGTRTGPSTTSATTSSPSTSREVLLGANLDAADPAHLPLISALVAERESQLRSQHTGPSDVPRRIEVLWVRSTATHAAWCERRHAATLAARAMTRDVICVAQIDRGLVVGRWSYG
ncbi:MAG TPA: hypothetical protein VFE90_15160 [Myxococcales bacterium]|nr:hypothetical protein [Myxococcales bacterium]